MFGMRWIVGLVVVGLVGGMVLLPGASARDISGTLTAPSGGNPFGGDVVGSYEITVRGRQVEIEADVSSRAPQGFVYEGWLVDMQTGYKLSLGQLRSGSLEFEQRMVNPYTYGVLVITIEPARDLDPNPDAPVAGALLATPFGQ